MKFYNTAEEALDCVQTGHTIMVGGFGLVGGPLTLIDTLVELDVNDLTIISNNLGEQGQGLGKLLEQKKVKKAIGSYFTGNRDVGDAFQRGEIEIELLPQGTLAESIRAGGAGIAGYYTKTSFGTNLAKGKETKMFKGEEYVLEEALQADIAIIRAYKADTLGNLVYYKTARNFNPLMATAAKTVIVEVEEIVEASELKSDEIATPHLFVDRVILAKKILTKEGVIEHG